MDQTASLITAIAALIAAVVAALGYVIPNPGGRVLKYIGLSLVAAVVVVGIVIIALRDRDGPSCEEMFQITSPPDGQEISGRAGAEITGTACQEDYIWLLDRDPYDGYFYQVNQAPLDIVNGTWEQTDSPIGNENNDDIGTAYTIVAIRASETCNHALQAARPGPDNTVQFKTLPQGCPDTNGKDGVRKVRLKKVKP